MHCEQSIRAEAEALGLTLPRFTKAQFPEVFQQWADRVQWAAWKRGEGKLTEDMLVECDRALGVARAPRVFPDFTRRHAVTPEPEPIEVERAMNAVLVALTAMLAEA